MSRLTAPGALLLFPPPPAAAQASAHEARVRYESGQRLFDAGSYELAIVEFQAALRLSGRPALWFNIGQAYRLAGDCARALDAYERYVELDPRAAARTNAAERIEQMRACVQAAANDAEAEADGAPDAAASDGEAAAADAATPTSPDEAATQATPAAALAPAPVEAPAPPPSPRLIELDDGSTRRWIGGGVATAGAVAAGASLYLAMRAAGTADELSSRYAWGGTWDDGASADEAQITRDRRTAAVLAGAGGVALAAGLYLYLSGRAQGEYARRFTVTPRAGGAEAVWTWPL